MSFRLVCRWLHAEYTKLRDARGADRASGAAVNLNMAVAGAAHRWSDMAAMMYEDRIRLRLSKLHGCE